MTDQTEIDAPVALLLNVIRGDEAEVLEHIEASTLSLFASGDLKLLDLDLAAPLHGPRADLTRC